MNRSPRDEVGNPELVDVTVGEMLAAMESARQCDDDDAFRYFQTTVFSNTGNPIAGPTLRLTIGQLRKELG